MNSLKFLRQTKTPFNNTIMNDTLRGGKKKADKKADAILTEHVLNMYKDKNDVTVLPDNYYPVWLKSLARPQLSTEEFYAHTVYGIAVKIY